MHAAAATYVACYTVLCRSALLAERPGSLARTLTADSSQGLLALVARMRERAVERRFGVAAERLVDILADAGLILARQVLLASSPGSCRAARGPWRPRR